MHAEQGFVATRTSLRGSAKRKRRSRGCDRQTECPGRVRNGATTFASNWDDSGQVKWLRHAKIDLLRGHGRLTGERRVSVTDKDGITTNLTARQAVAVCTGSRPAIPDVPGLAEAHPWTSREATSAKSVPRRLAILGGGVVACEMATAWKQLGTEEITVIERGARLIPNCESFAGELLKAAFEQRGISVLTDTTVRRVERATRWCCPHRSQQWANAFCRSSSCRNRPTTANRGVGAGDGRVEARLLAGGGR